jgi:hypothetical protein
MDGKIEQRVCIEFCSVNPLPKTREMLREAFGKHSLTHTTFF